jgi:hypothetical protein
MCIDWSEGNDCTKGLTFGLGRAMVGANVCFRSASALLCVYCWSVCPLPDYSSMNVYAVVWEVSIGDDDDDMTNACVSSAIGGDVVDWCRIGSSVCHSDLRYRMTVTSDLSSSVDSLLLAANGAGANWPLIVRSCEPMLHQLRSRDLSCPCTGLYRR